MPLDPSQEDFKYWAFISYSHSDDNWAEWLHKGLETYKIPKRLIGKPSREGIVPRRVFPVFRDRDELPGSANLGDNIESALRLSRYLIVICSPRAVHSKWVDKEIRMFKSWGREDRVLCLVVDGEPNASSFPQLGQQECFPEAIRYWVDHEQRITEIPTEPIAADARKGKDGKRNALLKLLAGIIGVDFDALRQRDHEREERQLKIVLATAFILLFIFSVLGVGFYFQRNEAIRSRNVAEIERVRAEQARARADLERAAAEEARDLEARAKEEERAAREQAEAAAAAEREAKVVAEQARKKEELARVQAEQARRGEEQARLAAEEARIAAEKAELEMRRTLSVSDLTSAGRLIDENNEAIAMAYLSRALRYDPGNPAVVSRAVSLLSQRNWPLPAMEPIRHESEVSLALYSPDGRWLATVAGSTVRILDSGNGNLACSPMVHGQKINSATFSPDGKLLLTASDDGTAQLWNIPTGTRNGAPITHKDRILYAVFSRDGHWIGTASQDKSARVWDAATGSPVTPPLQHDGPVRVILFNPVGKSVLTTSVNTARIWDVTSGHSVGIAMAHDGGVYSADYSPDGRYVATGSGDRTARLWNAITGELVAEPLKHDNWVFMVKFSPDGRHLLTASSDTKARIWDVSSRQQVGASMKHEGGVNTAVFSPNARWIVTSSADGTARVWDAFSGEMIAEPMRHKAPVRQAHFSPDGRRVTTASADGTARIWSIVNSKPGVLALEHDQPLNGVSFTPDGRHLISFSADRTAKVWDVATGRKAVEPLRHKKSIGAIAISPDGRFLATGSDDFTAQVWELSTGMPAFSPPLEHQGVVTSVQFSPDGRRLLTASDDRRIRLWDLSTGSMSIEPLRHEGEIKAAQFNADGQFIVTACSDRKGRIWSANTGKLLASVSHGAEVRSVAISPDGRWLATGSEDRTARIWDAASGRPITDPLPHDGPVNSVVFSPKSTWQDNKWILTASDKILRLWEAPSGKAVTEPMKHNETIRSVQFSPNGEFLLSAAGKSVQVWDRSGKPVAEPLIHDGSVKQAVFSPDGTSIATAASDQKARVWFFSPRGTAPDWLVQLTTGIARYKLDDFGAAEYIHDTWSQLETLKASFNVPSPGDQYTQWGRWLLTDRLARNLTPFNAIPVSDYIDQQVAEGSPTSLKVALDLQPDHALALAKTARLSLTTEEAEYLSILAERYAPTNPDVLWLRALTLQRFNRLAESWSVMERAIQFDPRAGVTFGPTGFTMHQSKDNGAVVRGWIPLGWIPHNSTPLLDAHFSKVEEVPQPGLTAIELRLDGPNKGQTELRGPRVICQRYNKCVIEGWVRSPIKSDLGVTIAQFVDPAQKYREQLVRTTPEWKRFRIQYTPTQNIASEVRLFANTGAHLQVASVTVRVE